MSGTSFLWEFEVFRSRPVSTRCTLQQAGAGRLSQVHSSRPSWWLGGSFKEAPARHLHCQEQQHHPQGLLGLTP